MVKAQDSFSKSFAVSDNMAEKFWDMWLVGLGSMSWSQEQTENMLKKYLEQRKVNREESTKLMEDLLTQAKNNQMQMQKMIQEAVTFSMEKVDIPGVEFFDSLNKRIEELAKKIDNMEQQGK